MSLENRPYVGTWGIRNQSLVRYTPDMLVYINGYLHIPGCRACNGSIDFQKYITSVTVDPSINAVANASISMSIPQHASEAFTGDGNYLLKTGLFVTIYMRGYFPMKGVAGRGEEASTVANFDPLKVPVHPYYQVFRGVVTEVSHEYNGGMYTVSMSCSDFLHFWSNLKVATNGALFGPRPANSNVQVYLRGHRFTSASPYAIIYSLFRIGFGSAGGVEFTMGRKTNVASVSDSTGQSLSKMAGLNQERLFNSRNVNLRMYGIDGTLYNGFSQSYLGAFQASGQKEAEESALATQSATHDRNIVTMTDNHLTNARRLGFNPLSVSAAIGTPSEDDPYVINVTKMQAFTQDIQAQGQVNQFETDYMTKLEIAQAVCEVTGFEFYQDVDGDIVFKPAFYNMDTREDPVYVVADRDLISLSEQDSEPEATYIKGTGSHFQNVSGTGLEGWLGVAAMYADYRLVADFGWREATFETAYLSDARAIYISAINRLDIVNSGRRSCNITIPLRPEMKPGYPVYLEGMGCYYYIEALNHSFQFGGQCTTQITGTAKRGKFHAPGNTGGPITVDNIQLDNPYLAATPISSEGGPDGPPRYMGFPNVVLALDPDYLNTATMLNVAAASTVDQVFQLALTYGVIEFTGEGGVPSAQYDGEFVLRTSNITTSADAFTKAELETEWTNVQAALLDENTPLPSGRLAEVVAAVQRQQPDASQRDLINYLTLLNDSKARLAPGMSLTGQYRYYSCSHPVKEHQGQKAIDLGDATQAKLGYTPGEIPRPTNPVPVDMFQPGTATLQEGTPDGGMMVTALNEDGTPGQRILQTSQINFVTFGRVEINTVNTMIKIDLAQGYAYNLQINTQLKEVFKQSLIGSASQTGPAEMCSARFESKYNEILNEIQTLAESLVLDGVFEAVSTSRTYTRAKERVDTVTKGIRKNSQSARNRDPGSNTCMQVYRTDDATAVGHAAASAAKSLYTLGRTAFSVAISRARNARGALASALNTNLSTSTLEASNAGFVGSSFDGGLQNPDPLYRARDVFLAAVSDGSITFGTSNGTTTVNASFDNTTTQIAATPVFPVSDSAGYEVYGSFAYGRGITVTSYATLLQQAGDNGTVVAGTGNTTSYRTLLAIEDFLASLRANPSDPQAALEGAVTFATLENGVEVADATLVRGDLERALAAEGLEIVGDTIVEREADSTAIQAGISGAPVVSSDRGQSTLAANAPVELANIDPGTNEICACKGAEAQFFLQAFSGDYASLETEEAVQTFLEDEAMSRAMGWEMGKEAMAGQIRDSTYTSMGERFQKFKGDYAELFSSTENAFSEVGAEFAEFNFGDFIDQSIQEFDEAGVPINTGNTDDE